MTTATLRLSTPIAATRTAPRKSFLARFYDSFVEARMRAAMREIALHRHLIPEQMTSTLVGSPEIS